jgi:hypothetical protein
MPQENEDEEGCVLYLESMEEHVESLEILRIVCMHEEDRVLEVVAMEEHKVEILMPKHEIIKEDEDEEGDMLKVNQGACKTTKNIMNNMHA